MWDMVGMHPRVYLSNSFQGQECKGKDRCKGLRWVGKDLAPEQCKFQAKEGAAYCGVHLKALPYGDIDRPKDHPGCPMYMPQVPNKAAKAFWAKWKGKLQPKRKPVQAPTKPALLVPSDPVAFLLHKILEGTRQKEQMVNLQDPAGQLLTLGCPHACAAAYYLIHMLLPC